MNGGILRRSPHGLPGAVLGPVRVEIARKPAPIHSKTRQERRDRVHYRHGKDGEMVRAAIEPAPNPPDAHAIRCRLRYCPAGNSWAARADRRPNAADADRDARRSGKGNAVAGTVNKHIRIDEEIWKRLEVAAKDRETTANRLLSELAAQWLENREWPRTDVQVQVARSSLFTAQAVARDMIAAGREKEIEEIRDSISTIVPDLEAGPLPTKFRGK